MSHDGSFVGAFNLSSQAGVAAVLAAIRASQLSSSEKNELRDLVFSYTNGGGDVSVRIALEQKLSAHAIIPVVPQRGGGAAPVLPFGTYRPTPNFKAPSPITESVLPPQPVPSNPTVVVPPPIPQPIPPPEPAPLAPPPVKTPVPPLNVPAAAPVPPPPVPMDPVPVVQPMATVPPPVAAPAMTGAQPEAVYLERIRQIKTAVNSKVGNPVNLVDINNAVGREYMNALLEAMKKLGSGAISEMEPAMKRLETALVAVEGAIKDHEAKLPAAPVVPEPVNVVPPVFTRAPVSAPAPAPDFGVSQPSVETAVPIPTPPIPEAAFVADPSLPQSSFASSAQAVPPRPDVITDQVSVPDIPRAPRLTRPETVTQDPDTSPSGFELQTSTPPTPPASVPAPRPPVPASLAQEPRLRTPNDLPDAASLETGEKGDPLSTKEVDDGLEQLLSDWSLFKKSGLFGTGPKGREHPLFKKISGLQVPLLLAGRFEGANQEIRQSITDYMNGWRYEQGIIYQPGETFERYLRRVIRHILDLQKKRRPS